MDKLKKGSYIEKDQWILYCYITHKISEYCYENNIKDIILIDRSARLAYIGIKEYYTHKYWDQKRPNIYFINPEKIIRDDDLKCQFINKFKNTNMINNKKDPILVFDTCMHTWNTMLDVITFLWDIWFTNIKGWVWHTKGSYLMDVDLTICKWWLVNHCYPFWYPKRTECLDKNSDSLFCCFQKYARYWVNSIYSWFKERRREFKDLIQYYLSMTEQEKKSYLSQGNYIYFKDKNLT